MTRLRAKVVRELEKVRDLEHKVLPGRDDGFSFFVYRGKEFAHFHNDNELDLRLTKQVIKKEGLEHPSGSQQHPKRSPSSPWIELRFHNATEVREVLRLAMIAVDGIRQSGRSAES